MTTGINAVQEEIFSRHNPRPSIPCCPHCGGKGEYFTEQSEDGFFEQVVNIWCNTCTYQSYGAVVIKTETEQVLISRWNQGIRSINAEALEFRGTGEQLEDKINFRDGKRLYLNPIA